MKFIFCSLVVFCIYSCTMQPKLQYQFSDKEQSLSCDGENNGLLNEALHSFEKDILEHNPSEQKTQIAGYGQFMYKGMLGTAKYDKIASDHSLAIRDALISENILLINGGKSNLNYEHPAVQCVLSKIENKDLQRTINALLQTNSMDPSMFNSRLRNFGSRSGKNRYQAAYVALDAYYQNLIGVTLEKTNE